MKRATAFLGLVFTFLLLASFALTAQTSVHAQGEQFSTATPGPDGRILYTVQEGDGCLRISLLTGVSVTQLTALNRLDANCSLTIGQVLLIGVGGPGGSTATVGPASTPTTAPPTATAFPGSVNVCVQLYDDINGDALRQETEVLIAGGAVSITGASGEYSQTAATLGGIDPVCFLKVPVGNYNVSVAPPDGYNPTSALNYALEVKTGDVKLQTGDVTVGDQIFVDFGAQKSSQPETNGASTTGEDNSPILGIIGAFLLLAGLGLGVYGWRVYGRRPNYMSPPTKPSTPK